MLLMFGSNDHHGNYSFQDGATNKQRIPSERLHPPHILLQLYIRFIHLLKIHQMCSKFQILILQKLNSL